MVYLPIEKNIWQGNNFDEEVMDQEQNMKRTIINLTEISGIQKVIWTFWF